MKNFKANNLKINIVKNTSQNTCERDFELLVNYVEAIEEIYRATKLHEFS